MGHYAEGRTMCTSYIKGNSNYTKGNIVFIVRVKPWHRLPGEAASKLFRHDQMKPLKIAQT